MSFVDKELTLNSLFMVATIFGLMLFLYLINSLDGIFSKISKGKKKRSLKKSIQMIPKKKIITHIQCEAFNHNDSHFKIKRHGK
jgi:uncharacterized membrane protein